MEARSPEVEVLLNEGEVEEIVARDRWWALLFGVCIFLSGLMTLRCVASGEVGSLSHPMNYQGLACGRDRAVAHLPNVYYPLSPRDGRQLKIWAERATCVARCPTETDVASKGYLAVSDSSVVQDKNKNAFMSVLHTVRTPLYATHPPNKDHLCLPQHPKLANQVHALYHRDNRSGLRSLAADVLSQMPLAIGLSLLAILASQVLSYCVYGLPLLTSNIAICGSILQLACLSLYLLASPSPSPSPPSQLSPAPNPFASTSPLASLLIGAASLALCAWFYTNRNFFSASTNDLLVRTSVLSSQAPSTKGTIAILQMCALIVGLGYMLATLILQSKTNRKAVPFQAKLDPNGGLQVMSLDTKIRPSLFSTDLSTVFVLASGAWALEFLLTTSRIINAYTSARMYFAKADASGLRRVPSAAPVDALAKSLQYGSGSVALASAIRFLTRGVRVALMTSASYRYNRYDQALLSPVETHPKTLGSDGVHAVCDTVHNGFLTELALTSRSVKNAMRTSSTRMKDDDQWLAASITGVSSLVTWSLVCCIVTTAFCVAFLVGRHSASSPLASALVIAILCGYVGSMGLCSIDSCCDSYLYSYMMECDARQYVKTQEPDCCPQVLLTYLDALHHNMKEHLHMQGYMPVQAQPHTQQSPYLDRQSPYLERQPYVGGQPAETHTQESPYIPPPDAYTQPGHTQQAYTQSAYTQPAYTQQAYTQPAYTQGGSQQVPRPGYLQTPTYTQMPGYTQLPTYTYTNTYTHDPPVNSHTPLRPDQPRMFSRTQLDS